MFKSNCLMGTSLLEKSSVSSLGKRRDWVLQVAGILGMCGGWKGSLRAQHAAWEKRTKIRTGKISHGPEVSPVFNLFHLSQSLVWIELGRNEPGVGGSPLTRGSLDWGATGTGLLLCSSDHFSGQHADLGLFSQEKKAFVVLGCPSGVVSARGPLARALHWQGRCLRPVLGSRDGARLGVWILAPSLGRLMVHQDRPEGRGGRGSGVAALPAACPCGDRVGPSPATVARPCCWPCHLLGVVPPCCAS